MFKVQFIFVALWLTALSVAVEAKSPRVPPPPSTGVEIFSPTLRTHIVKGRCGATDVKVEWKYNGEKVEFLAVSFKGKNISKTERSKVNEWVSEFDSDIFVFVECDASAAAFSFIDARLAGTARARKIVVNLVNGEMRLIRRIP